MIRHHVEDSKFPEHVPSDDEEDWVLVTPVTARYPETSGRAEKSFADSTYESGTLKLNSHFLLVNVPRSWASIKKDLLKSVPNLFAAFAPMFLRNLWSLLVNMFSARNAFRGGCC